MLLNSQQHASNRIAHRQQSTFDRWRWSIDRNRKGPDLYGNAINYGRALYTTQHHSSEAFKIKGREFIIDSDYTMAVAWKLYFGDLMTDLVFGPLRWTPDN